MLYPRYHFTYLPRILSSALLPALLVSVICVSSQAQQLAPLERKVESPSGAAEEERKSLLNMGWTTPPPKAVVRARPNGGSEREVEIKAEDQHGRGERDRRDRQS